MKYLKISKQQRKMRELVSKYLFSRWRCENAGRKGSRGLALPVFGLQGFQIYQFILLPFFKNFYDE